MSYDIDYEKDTTIDSNNLDLEWLAQPNLYMKYAGLAATARREMDLCKEQLDLKKAEMDNYYRRNPPTDLKVTEAVVSNLVITSKEVKQKQEEYNEAKYNHDMISAAVKAMDQKKTALENLVKLMSQEYFATPSSPKDIDRNWVKDQKRKRTTEKIKERRRTR